MSCKDPLQSILLLILSIKLQIICKILRCLPVLEVLMHNLTIHLFTKLFINLDQPWQVFPSSGCDKHFSIYCIFHTIEILFSKLQIRKHCRMDSNLIRIFLPDIKISFHIDPLDPIQCHHIKFPHRLIIFRRIPCRHNDPSLRHTLITKHLAL